MYNTLRLRFSFVLRMFRGRHDFALSYYCESCDQYSRLELELELKLFERSSSHRCRTSPEVMPGKLNVLYNVIVGEFGQ